MLSNINSGKICPYCNQPSQYTSNKVIQKYHTGMIYYCEQCNAYVGVHKGTNKSLGRLANKELRENKKLTHYYFDKIWNELMNKYNWSKYKARNSMYLWLSNELHIPLDETHIGMFDIELCNKTINICKQFLEE